MLFPLASDQHLLSQQLPSVVAPLWSSGARQGTPAPERPLPHGVDQGPCPDSATDPCSQRGTRAAHCLMLFQLSLREPVSGTAHVSATPPPSLGFLLASLVVCFDPQSMLLSPLVQLSCTALTISPGSRQALKPLRHHQRVLSGPNQSAFRKQWSLAEASVTVWADLNVTEFVSLPSFLQADPSGALALKSFIVVKLCNITFSILTILKHTVQ